jgi:hypothetical protein
VEYTELEPTPAKTWKFEFSWEERTTMRVPSTAAEIAVAKEWGFYSDRMYLGDPEEIVAYKARLEEV